MTAVENLSIAMAAKQLQMTEGAVLVARCRVLLLDFGKRSQRSNRLMMRNREIADETCK